MGRYGYGSGYGWRPYVPVARRRADAAKKLEALRKKGLDVQPVVIEGRKISRTFWGQAWCDHLESFSDYSNRLPRGRTYVRNGSVCHLGIKPGDVDARVAGSSMYRVQIQIKRLPVARWREIKLRCAGKIGSLLELLQGRLADEVMQVVTDPESGLFPRSKEISVRCSCLDWAGMCKHIAAVMYGIGARLDVCPELLFTLRGVDQGELIEANAEAAVTAATSSSKAKRIATSDLSDLFGIDLGASPAATTASRPPGKTAKATANKSAKKSAKKSPTKANGNQPVKKKKK